MQSPDPNAALNLINKLKQRELVTFPAVVIDKRSVVIGTTSSAGAAPDQFSKTDLSAIETTLLDSLFFRYTNGKLVLRFNFESGGVADNFARSADPILGAFVGADGARHNLMNTGEPKFRVSSQYLNMVHHGDVYRFARVEESLPRQSSDWTMFRGTWTAEMVVSAAGKIRLLALPVYVDLGKKKYRVDVFGEPSGTAMIGAENQTIGTGETRSVVSLSKFYDSQAAATNAALNGFDPWRGETGDQIVQELLSSDRASSL